MIMTPLRTFPGLFVGRREVIAALETRDLSSERPRAAFVCGACEQVVLTSDDRADLRDVVVKCRCGEYNQL